MSTNYNTCFIDSNGRDVSEEFVEKSYLLDVYPNLINPAKTPALWGWGNGSAGRLGTNDTIARSSPVQTISAGTNWKEVYTMGSGAAAIKTDGTLWLWGSNSGTLGNNSSLDQSSPVQTVSGGTNWKQISGSLGITGFVAAIKTDGTLWSWGINNAGQLGANNVIRRSSPVQTVSGGTNWKQVSAGNSFAGAIKTDGTLWLWGLNSAGALGNNTVVSRSSPVQTISAGTNWKQVSAGCFHVAAIKTDGTLWLWGGNSFGPIGDNSVVSKSSPVQTVSGGTNWKQVSADSDVNHVAAIKTDGTLWLWGRNEQGQIGDNSVVSKSSPVQTVSGGTNWKFISLSFAETASIKTDGTLWMWGANTCVTALNTSTINSSSPIQFSSGGTNWKEISIRPCHVMGIKEEGDW